MHRLLVVGLNHTTAPLAVRERLAFGGEQRRAAVLSVFGFILLIGTIIVVQLMPGGKR